MKTALDLPDELVKEVKIRAVQEGRKLKDVIAELLRRGLDADSAEPPRASFAMDGGTGLPVIVCRRPARLTPDRVSKILLDQEVEWRHDAGR